VNCQNLVKLGQAVDKERWSTAPAVVNAFYSPNKNDIVFPAGGRLTLLFLYLVQ
jgi:predicted metalloendopeptidase